ncbi:MAG: LamG domain-containing protein [Chloroflexi bacterium]|nr:LamG domain-containing protein [Chloroflexota bacterium]
MPSVGTIEAWVSAPVLEDRGNHLLWAATPGWDDGIAIIIHGAYGMLFRHIGHGDIFLPYTWTPNTWHHVAMTYSASGTSAYLDGTLAGQNPSNGTLPILDHLIIGSGTPGYHASQSWKGRVDEVQIWDAVRTQAEIQNDMLGPPPPPPPPGITPEEVQAMIDTAIAADNVDDDAAIDAAIAADNVDDDAAIADLQSQINALKNAYNSHVHDKGSGARNTSDPIPTLSP